MEDKSERRKSEEQRVRRERDLEPNFFKGRADEDDEEEKKSNEREKKRGWTQQIRERPNEPGLTSEIN